MRRFTTPRLSMALFVAAVLVLLSVTPAKADPGVIKPQREDYQVLDILTIGDGWSYEACGQPRQLTATITARPPQGVESATLTIYENIQHVDVGIRESTLQPVSVLVITDTTVITRPINWLGSDVPFTYAGIYVTLSDGQPYKPYEAASGIGCLPIELDPPPAPQNYYAYLPTVAR